jgi:hypothetical protein
LFWVLWSLLLFSNMFRALSCILPCSVFAFINVLINVFSHFLYNYDP